MKIFHEEETLYEIRKSTNDHLELYNAQNIYSLKSLGVPNLNIHLILSQPLINRYRLFSFL